MNGRTTGVWVAAGCALAIIGGCARERTESGAQVQYERTGTGAEMGGGEVAAGRLTDAEVAKVLATVNRGEVKQAEVALGKTQSPEVRDYAERMLEEHRQALERAEEVAGRMEEQPRTSALDQQLTNDTEQTMQELERAETASFDDQYLSSQIEGHRKVLEVIDNVLLPSVQHPALRAEIEAVRPVIWSHLNHAEQLRTGS